jgi:transcriptional regulator with XRE-family HTH domain
MSTVGNNIAWRRRQLGWTQEELALRMGYKSKSTINKIELGINDIPQSKIARFAEVLETTPAHLMGWDEEKAPPEPQLNEGEKLLLRLFRQVPEAQQELVLQMIRAALENLK